MRADAVKHANLEKYMYSDNNTPCVIRGLAGPDDFELVTGADDDGEKHAGARVLKVMQAEGIIDAVVVVSRWWVLDWMVGCNDGDSDGHWPSVYQVWRRDAWPGSFRPH